MTTDLRLVPLALLAAEGHGDSSVEQLAQMLAADVVIDVETGLRCVDATVARRLYDDREGRRRAQAQQLQDAANASNSTRAHLAARAARQRELLRDSPNLSAYELAAADDIAGRVDDTTRHIDELREAERQGFAGVGYTYPRLTRPGRE